MREMKNFLEQVLVPCATESLCTKYDQYCAGEDIGIETKSDATPASLADRETELKLRALIEAQFPDHGIWGEEFGPHRLDCEWVWVLDPLDGTKEFLAQYPEGFGSLIALLQDGVPVLGAIVDPMKGRFWLGRERRSAAIPATIADSIFACTNPEGMFAGGPNKALIGALRTQAKTFRTLLNCLGFSAVIDGSVDVVVESSLGLHDVAALVPPLCAAGCTVIDFRGDSYDGRAFDLSVAGTVKYDVIAAAGEDLARQVLDVINAQGAA